MPTKTGKDSKGCFAQWGSQKKYYYTCGNEKERKAAIAKANKQAISIGGGKMPEESFKEAFIQHR